MPSIIPPTKQLVKDTLDPTILSLKGVKLQPKPTKLPKQIFENLNVVFMGTPEFAVPILAALIKSEFKPKAVITALDKPVGRQQLITPPPVKILAQENQIPVYQPKTSQELLNQVFQIKPDLIILAAYGKILPKEIINLPKYNCLNVHPSLLPKLRGPSPIQFAILEGETRTGVTIMLMNQNLDEGPILSQEAIRIKKEETSQTLEEKLSGLGAKLLLKTLEQWIVLKEMPETARRLIYPQEQDNLQATYTKILTKQDGKILWNKTAQELEKQIRAFYPWPGSFTIFKTAGQPKNLSLKIIKASASPLQTPKEMGEVFLTEDKRLAVQAGKNCLIIDKLQLEGGKPMNATDFLNGHPEIIGTILH